jgi:hypothetical protein
VDLVILVNKKKSVTKLLNSHDETSLDAVASGPSSIRGGDRLAESRALRLAQGWRCPGASSLIDVQI